MKRTVIIASGFSLFMGSIWAGSYLIHIMGEGWWEPPMILSIACTAALGFIIFLHGSMDMRW